MLQMILMIMGIHWMYNCPLSSLNYHKAIDAELKTDRYIHERVKEWEEFHKKEFERSQK